MTSRGAHGLVALVAVGAVAAVFAGPAGASQLIDRNASNATLKVNTKGQAMIEYKLKGRARHALVFGAVNARQSDAASAGNKPPQVKFTVDYSGGYSTLHKKNYWKTFVNACKPYNGPALSHVVAACDAPDGSYWALQSWQVELPDLGFAPWLTQQSSYHLQASHWTGDIAKIEAYVDWSNKAHDSNLFGRITYLGHPVYGFSTSRFGSANDGYVRQVYTDTYNAPAYGKGWHRENAFVPHRPNGNFCYALTQRDATSGGNAHPPGFKGKFRGPGTGSAYRMFVLGPGVTPDVTWQGKGIGKYNPNNPAQVAYEQRMLALNKQIAGSDPICTSG